MLTSNARTSNSQNTIRNANNLEIQKVDMGFGSHNTMVFNLINNDKYIIINNISPIIQSILYDLYYKNSNCIYKLYITQPKVNSYYENVTLNFKLNISENHKFTKHEKKQLTYLYKYYNTRQVSRFSFNNLWKNSYSVKDYNYIQPKNCNLTLYNYQGKSINFMKNIENNNVSKSTMKVSQLLRLDPYIYKNKYTNYDVDIETWTRQTKNKEYELVTKGGILSDEVGLGKTITSIAHIINNPSKELPIQIDKQDKMKFVFKNGLIFTPATLIIVPPNLIKQWQSEIKKVNSKLRVISLITRVNHKKIDVSDILGADIVLVTTNFLKNKQWYHARLTNSKNAAHFVKHYPDKTIINAMKDCVKKEHAKSFENLYCYKIPFLHMFNWYRIMIDEGHEFISSSDYKLNYLKICCKSLLSDNKWYVTATPFIQNNTLFDICEYIGLNFKNNEDNSIIGLNKYCKDNKIELNSIYKYILENVYIRHTKETVIKEIQIPDIIEENILLEFTDIEREVYNSISKSDTKRQQQICCHPSINDLDANAFGSFKNIPNLEEARVGIIESRKKQLRSAKYQLTILIAEGVRDSSKRKTKYELTISKLQYLIKIFEDMEVKEDKEIEDCPITLEPMTDPVITSCGHKFSREGIMEGIKFGKKECPICRKKLTPNDIFSVKKQEIKNKVDDYVYKYGTKMGKMIRMLQKILKDNNNRVIIFSQWDNLLRLVSNTLTQININNIRVKGTAYQRANCIKKFKE